MARRTAFSYCDHLKPSGLWKYISGAPSTVPLNVRGFCSLAIRLAARLPRVSCISGISISLPGSGSPRLVRASRTFFCSALLRWDNFTGEKLVATSSLMPDRTAALLSGGMSSALKGMASSSSTPICGSSISVRLAALFDSSSYSAFCATPSLARSISSLRSASSCVFPTVFSFSPLAASIVPRTVPPTMPAAMPTSKYSLYASSLSIGLPAWMRVKIVWPISVGTSVTAPLKAPTPARPANALFAPSCMAGVMELLETKDFLVRRGFAILPPKPSTILSPRVSKNVAGSANKAAALSSTCGIIPSSTLWSCSSKFSPNNIG